MSDIERSAGQKFTPFFLADRPNHVEVLEEAAEETQSFGVLTQATVSESVQDLVAGLSVPTIVDCGAFAEESFDGTFIDLFDRIEAMDADLGLIPDDIGDRESTDENVAHGMRLFRRGAPRWSFEPVAVVQGDSKREMAASLWDCYQMGADRIAIGGLLRTDGNRSGGHATSASNWDEVLRYLRTSHPRIWESVWIFALGCNHPRRRPQFSALGVNAADSKRWLFQYDEDLPSSRHDQLVREVVESATHHTPTLTQALSDGGDSALVPDGGVRNGRSGDTGVEQSGDLDG